VTLLTFGANINIIWIRYIIRFKCVHFIYQTYFSRFRLFLNKVSIRVTDSPRFVWIVFVLILVITGIFFCALSAYLEKDLFDGRQEEIVSVIFGCSNSEAEHY
jgi:hypothetical protein